MRKSQPISVERYAEERRQGEAIARGSLDHVWGWSTPAGGIRAQRRAAFLIRACELGPGVRALELGPGMGEYTERLADCGCDLVAVELSEATAERARDRVRSRAEVVVGNDNIGEGIAARNVD